MRLKKLILHGFKSFADRTEFVFDSPIVGIVGPNGCGKSNVVDGFKWVLGEQSAKSLRGDAMMDVIFNGAASRKPSGMAEVTLVFDNPQRQDGTRFLNLDVDEVSVGRRLFRDGTSEYTLNNQPARLKDIRELFLDTGVGVDAYSVIEQGRVAALLEANPAERRLIFEEAAGISKYKVKKKEAQRKLERVDQNLLRVNDIVEEVEKRLRSVRIQAGRARTYQEHSTRLSELRLTYAIQEYHVQYQQSVELKAKHDDAQFRLEDLSASLARAQNELARKREDFDALTQRKQQLEYELVQAQATMQSAQQKQQYAQQQLTQIAEQLTGLEAEKTESRQKLAEISQSLESEEATLKRLTEELDDHRRQIDDRREAFKTGQLQLNQMAEQIEQNKSAIIELMRKLAQTNSRLGAIEIERRNIATQHDRLSERRDLVVAEIQAMEAERTKLDSEMQGITGEIADRQAWLEQKRSAAVDLGQQIAQVGENLGSAKEHRSGLLSRQKLLEDLEARREGVSEGVKSVLRQRDARFPFIRGLVADILRVDVEHAHVIEAALDGRDQWLVASDPDATIAASQAYEELEGRVNILCDRDTGAPPVSSPELKNFELQNHGQVARATDLVTFDPADRPIVEHLLGATLIVDNLAAANELHVTGPQGFRYVTRSGEVLEADGTLRAGPLTAAMGLLSRRSELDSLARQLAEVDQRIDDLAQQLNEGATTAKALEHEIGEIRNTIYQSNTAKVELASQIAQIGDKQAALRREQPVLDRELDILVEQTARLREEEQGLARQKELYENDQASRQTAVEELTARHAQVAEDLKLWGEQLTASRVLLGQVQEKQLASQQQVQRGSAAKAEIEQQIARLEKSIESVISRRDAVQHELEQARYEETRLVESQKSLVEQAEKSAMLLQEAGETVKILTTQVDSLRGEHGTIEQEFHHLEVKLGEVRVRLESMVQRTQEELQLDLPAKYAEHEAAGGYKPADMDWDGIATEIKDLREKIQRLGNVNVDAITEQDELEQRSQFLASQVADLTTSKQQLEQLIEEINRESSMRFEQTLNAVREHFQGMFRKLFGGGNADIYLETELEEKVKTTDEQGQTTTEVVTRTLDPLEAGIEVIARPPGKQPATISQLSGGEKAMTCIALLMSIFKSKPSPFCILDEVDAPLDEANTQRFGLIIQEFLDMSQFIVITHQKRTMQIADILYGVTMQEQGVSKRVAVKFDQVDSQGRIAEHAAA